MVSDNLQQKRELLKGVTDNLLLSIIEREGPLHGYEIVRKLEKASDGYFRFKEGTLYPALNRLEEDGSLTSRWENGRSAPRRCYSITELGRQTLKKKHIQWQQFSTAVDLVYSF